MNGKNQAVAGFVLGIVALVLGFLGGWLSVIALPVAVVGLVLAVMGGKALKAAGQTSGIATAGLVIGIIAVVLTAIFFFTCGICTICASCAVANAEKELANAYGDLLSGLNY